MKRGEIATVLSGAPERFSEPLIGFAKDLLHIERIDLILDHRLDVALVNLNYHGLAPQERFLVREIAQSRAMTSRARGSRTGVVVTRVAYGPDNPEWYQQCMVVARKEREVVKQWGIFPSVHCACLTPNGEIHVVEP